MKPVKLIVLGAGSRGTTYAQYALENPDQAQVVGVAEPRTYHRQHLAEAHGIPAEHVFTDWKDVARRDKFADAVIIATQDAMHAEPAVAFADQGYHILLEKPMAPNEADCARIAHAAVDNGIMLAVCHIFRYVQYTQRIKALIGEGAIGEVVSIQHFEPVGYWHQAHSFVRGNWGNEARSSFMLLAKACHEIDWLAYIMGVPCVSVSSFGSLKHFRREEQPEGAADRCLDCAVEPTCPYSAKHIYLDKFLRRGETGWPVDVLTPVVTEENVLEALRTGPYGRCVYACDNDVVDNQVVNLLYEGGKTATYTMNAFNKDGGKKTTIFGTHGEIRINGGYGELVDGTWEMRGASMEHFDFLTETTTEIPFHDYVDTSVSGHHYGDYYLMKHFVTAIGENRPEWILTGPMETLATHRTVFAAERARREHRVIDL